jgi:VanZ family protein
MTNTTDGRQNLLRIVFTTGAAGWATALLAASLTPSVPRSPALVMPSWWFVIGHFAAYFGLAFLLTLTFVAWSKRPSPSAGQCAAAAGIAAAYGVAMEILQATVPPRDPSVADAFVNFAGAATGAGAGWATARIFTVLRLRRTVI